MAYYVKCPACPAEQPARGPKNSVAALAADLDAHIKQKHMSGSGAATGYAAAITTGQDTGGGFWAPWYTGDNCHS